MSGPIIRTGATPEYWSNWDNIFGKTKKKSSAAKAEPKAPPAGKKSAGKVTAAKSAPAKNAVKKKAAPKKKAPKK